MAEDIQGSKVRHQLACRSLVCVFEVKDRSPFGWVSPVSRYEMLKTCETGDIVSIHTNPLWGGSWEWLEEARGLTDKRILAKGFHNTISDVRRAFDCGADFVLTVGWWPADDRCWHECESLEELGATSALRAVWNNRNPRTGATRPEAPSEARRVRDGWLCLASKIGRNTVVEADAALVGQSLFLR